MISVRRVLPPAVMPKYRSIIARPRVACVSGALSFGGRRFSELFGEHLPRHLLDRALREMAELERPISKADQPGDRIAEMFHDPPHLAVLSLLQRQGDPGVGALLAVELGADRSIGDAIDGDAAGERGEPRRVDKP